MLQVRERTTERFKLSFYTAYMMMFSKDNWLFSTRIRAAQYRNAAKQCSMENRIPYMILVRVSSFQNFLWEESQISRDCMDNIEWAHLEAWRMDIEYRAKISFSTDSCLIVRMLCINSTAYYKGKQGYNSSICLRFDLTVFAPCNMSSDCFRRVRPK